MTYNGGGVMSKSGIIASSHTSFLNNVEQVKKQSGAVIAHLSVVCSDLIVDSGMIEQLFNTAQNTISSSALLPNQKTSMLETMVSLCDKIEDVTQKNNMYFSILNDCIAVLTSTDAQNVFSSSSVSA
jgi:hypothetical protein